MAMTMTISMTISITISMVISMKNKMASFLQNLLCMLRKVSDFVYIILGLCPNFKSQRLLNAATKSETLQT